MASHGQPIGVGPEPAPIAQLIPLVLSVISSLYSLTQSIWNYTLAGITLSLSPVKLIVLPALIFVLAPINTSLRLILDLLLAPYYTVVFVSQTILPFYIIIGSAIFCGALLGLCARQVVSITGTVLLGPSGKEGRGRAAGRSVQPAPTLRTPSKGKKRTSVKFEQGA